MDDRRVSLWAADVFSRLRRNRVVKLWAVTVGVLLWLHVKTDQVYQVVVPLPLEVETSGRYVPASDLPEQVLVRFQGTGKQLLIHSFRQKMVVHPEITRVGLITIELSVDDVVNRGAVPVRAVGIVPPRSIVAEFDYAAERLVPVEARLGLGILPGHTTVGPVAVTPGSVSVKGPRRVVRSLQSVATDSLLQDGVNGPIDQKLALITNPGSNITYTPKEVRVRVDVQGMLERRIEGIPIKLLYNYGRRVRLQPSVCAVDVVGGSEWVAGLSAADFKATIDYRRRHREGTRRLAPEIGTPPDVRVIKIYPETFLLVE